MNIHKIVARDLPDLWFQAVHDILDHGRRFKIDRGSYAGQITVQMVGLNQTDLFGIQMMNLNWRTDENNRRRY